MTFNLQPYAAHKDSGVPWLGAVPAHWEMQSLGSLTKVVNDRGRPELPLLSVLREKGVVARSQLREDENRNYVPDDLSNYKVVRTGNLVINKMKAWQGSLGVAPQDGIVSPAYFVFDFRMAHKKFGHRLLRSKTYIAFYNQVSDGVRIGQWDLSIQGMKRIPVLVPPVEEQEAIARFLDHIDRRINRYIRAKRRLIALLNEQKQAIIHRAVTRGLDPDVPLKPSGVEWVGEVPAHWEVKKLKFLAKAIGGMTPSKANADYWKGSVPWVSPKDMKRSELDDSTDHISEEAIVNTGITILPVSAVLVVVRGMILRRTFPVAITNTPVTINQDMKALITGSELTSPYLAALLTGIQSAILESVEIAGHGTRRLRTDVLMNMLLPVPPINEQREIVKHLQLGLLDVEKATDDSKVQIDLIREYRTRLVADIVTGKVDVRGVALPEDGDAGEAGLFDEMLDEEGFDDEGEEDDAWEETEDGDE